MPVTPAGQEMGGYPRAQGCSVLGQPAFHIIFGISLMIPESSGQQVAQGGLNPPRSETEQLNFWQHRPVYLEACIKTVGDFSQ